MQTNRLPLMVASRTLPYLVYHVMPTAAKFIHKKTLFLMPISKEKEFLSF